VSRLSAGIAPARRGLLGRLRGLFGSGVEEEAAWEAAEEALIAADVGPTLAARVVAGARGRGTPPIEAIREELLALLAPRRETWRPHAAVAGQPQPILVVGVNGTGKTTTIAKLAALLRADGRSVLLAAADTFRAAAIEQLRAWAERLSLPVVAHAPGADPGAVVYDALDAASARGVDVVIADTAGRLHTKRDLMEELSKVRRVIDRRLPGARPDVLLVLDATTGQNGLHQARVFHEHVGLTGIVVTKMDSTSRGGIVFAIEQELGVPVLFLGIGERPDDLVPFDPEAFVRALFEPM
jgi:fused signal recognition particle receptor